MRVLTALLLSVILFPTATMAQADLTLSVSGVPADEIRGGNFTAQYSVHNQGPQDTDGNVVVTIALDNASIQSLAGGTGGTVNQTDDQNATVTYPSFPFGLTITNDVIIVTNGSGGDATVTISVATSNDSNASNNTFTATVAVPTRPEGDIQGTVYTDVNKDGALDAGDTPLPGVLVGLDNGSSRTSGEDGTFSWLDLFRRPYTMTVTLPDGFTIVIPAENPSTVNVEDGQVTTVVVLLNDENEVVPGRIAGRLTIDTTPMEGIRVYDDSNDNGTFEEAETSTMTDAEGDYEFLNLTPGTVFRVRAVVPAYAVPVDPSPANTDVAISPGTNALVDYTYRFSGVVAGFVYVDNDADGVFTDGVDEGYAYGEDDVEILGSAGIVEGAVNTGDALVGEIIYGSLSPDEYLLSFALPEGWERSQNVSSVTVSEETPFPEEIRIAVYERVNIRAEAFYDLNQNGAKDTGEPPAPGIETTCTSSGDCQGMTSTSDANGVISFFQVQPGTFTLDMTAPEGPGQFIAPANAQFQFVLNSGQDNVELQVAVREPVNGIPYPDVAVRPTAMPLNPAPGDEVQVSVVVLNRGMAEALEVNSNTRLVALEYISSSTTQGGCDYIAQTQTVRCTHNLLPAGDSVRVDVLARASVVGPAAVDASAETSSTESNELNNRVVVDLTVSASDLTMTLNEAEHQTCTPDWEFLPAGTTTDGNEVRYQVRIVNGHPDRDETVRVALEGLATVQEQTVVVPAQDVVFVTFSFRTDDWAWNADGTPRVTPYAFKLRMRKGEELLAEIEQELNVLPQPIVLVHGLWSNAGTWVQWPTFATAAHPGWEGRVFAVNTMETGVNPFETRGVDPTNFSTRTIDQNADALEAYIADVRQQTGSCHINVVGHSMGGLITRRFIQKAMPETESDGRPLMDKLIMLGTPNEGSPCAETALAVYARRKMDPAYPFPPNNLIELRRSIVAHFNAANSNKKGVSYEVMAGNNYPATCSVTNPGDFVVEASSAFAINTPSIVDVEATRSIRHDKMTGDESTFLEFVLPRLKPAEEASAPAGPAGPVASIASAGGSAVAGTAEIFTSIHDVSTGDATFTVGAADAISVTVFVSEDVTTQLVDPSGGVAWEVMAGSEEASGFFRAVTVDAPEAGDWRITFASSAPLAGIEADITVSALNPAFNVDATFGAPVADIVPVVATVTGDGSAVVTAEAISETVVTAPLFDDGAHGDGLAGDGVYGGDIAVGAAGTVIVAVRATRDGESRRVQSTVEIVTVTDVEAPPTEIPDAFRLAGVYPNPMRQNGMLELDVPESSLVRIRLVDALGREAALLATRHLEAGQSRVPLVVDVAPGVYVLVAETATWRAERRLVVVR